MKRNISEKTLVSLQKQTKSSKRSNCFECQKDNFGNSAGCNKRFLISVSVLGSPGPLRFLVNEEDLVAGVIDTALKLYAKEGRLPVLRSDPTKFHLYCANFGSDAMSPWDDIGSCGARNFVLCKKPEQRPSMTEARSEIFTRKKTGSWKDWINKSLSFKVLSH